MSTCTHQLVDERDHNLLLRLLYSMYIFSGYTRRILRSIVTAHIYNTYWQTHSINVSGFVASLSVQCTLTKTYLKANRCTYTYVSIWSIYKVCFPPHRYDTSLSMLLYVNSNKCIQIWRVHLICELCFEYLCSLQHINFFWRVKNARARAACLTH